MRHGFILGLLACLASVALAQAGEDAGADGVGLIGTVLLLVGLTAPLLVGIYFLRRQGAKAAPAQAPIDFAAEEAQLDKVAADLTQVEHAMGRGEHPDLRCLLEYATRAETAARRRWSLARAGDTSARRQLAKAVADAVLAADQAVELARRLHGTEAFAASGDRSGCFFCARPLANPDAYRRLSVKRGDHRVDVLACPNCAGLADRGQAPTVRTGQDGRTHWSELPDYDPYAGRHGAKAGWQDIPAGRFQPQRPLEDVARLAGGAALAAGAGAALPLLDLDAARDAGLAQEALQASARRATEQRRESSSPSHFTDHS